MNTQAAADLGIHLGSVVRVSFDSDAQELLANPGKPRVVATIRFVGLVVLSQNVVEDQSDALGSAEVLLSSRLTRELAACCASYSDSALQLVGGTSHVAAVKAEVGRLFPR